MAYHANVPTVSISGTGFLGGVCSERSLYHEPLRLVTDVSMVDWLALRRSSVGRTHASGKAEG